MKTINIFLSSLVVLVAFVLSGCSEPIQLYSGPKLSNSKVAILEVSRGYNNFNQLIIDGKDIWKDVLNCVSIPRWPTCHVAMLPGEHEISWTGTTNYTNFVYEGHGTLNAKAGGRYGFEVVFHAGRSFAKEGKRYTEVPNYRAFIKPLPFSKASYQDFTTLIPLWP